MSNNYDVDADYLKIVTLILPDPYLYSPTRQAYHQLNADISFRLDLLESPTTLSSRNAVPGADISGLLYLPLLDEQMSCRQIVYQYVPANTTTQQDLPVSNSYWIWIAIAPWISPACANDFLEAAENDDLRAFIFYLPDNSSVIPAADDPVWNLSSTRLGDQSTHFPVYAISGLSGAKIINALSLYSGDLIQVPHGHDLANEFPPQAYVRLAALLSLEGDTTLPSLWVIFLIVIGILIFIFILTSVSLHWLRYQNRKLLQQRIQRGDVDLELLGIKKLTVPLSVLNAMPLYLYPNPDELPIELARVIEDQQDCPICIQDFLPGISQIRQLPCQHIFHSYCIDDMLRQSSSLCPLCKKTSLPRGYCPPYITNAMVMRERRVRNMRDRIPKVTSSPRWIQKSHSSIINSTSHEQQQLMNIELEDRNEMLWQQAVTRARTGTLSSSPS